MPKKQKMPDWLEFLYAEMTKPPYFMQMGKQSQSGQSQAGSAQVTPDHTPQNASSTEKHDSDKGKPAKEQGASKEEPSDNRKRSGETQQNRPARPQRRATGGNRRTTTAGVPSAVLSRYAIEIDRQEQLPDILRVYTKDGKQYAAKQTELSMPHVRFVNRALSYAKRQGYTRFSPFLLNKNKSPGVLHDGHVYYLTDWIEGQQANFASNEHVAQTAYTLAQFHEATRGFKTEKYSPAGAFDLFELTQQRNRDLKNMVTRAEAKDNPDSFDQLLISLKSSLFDDGAESLQILQQSECESFLQEDKENPGISHLDVIPGNCIYTPNHSVTLIDFELSTFAPRALDIAHLLRRSLQMTHWNGEMAYACFLHFNAVRTMPQVEYKIVQALLQFPYRAWRVAHTRYHFFADSTQTDELQAFADEEKRRQSFLESLSGQIRQLSADN